jgi:phosphoenolpyruvate carboxylase
MPSPREPERAFDEHVATRYRLYSGLLLGLPYDLLQRVGRLLPVFAEHCRKALAQKEAPAEIVRRFFADNPSLTDVPPDDALFLFLQMVERQVVLFDALEEASFEDTHDEAGPGSVSHLLDEILRENRRAALADLIDQTTTRIVLTAHPTQFYPDTVQGIIQDLRTALHRNDPADVERLLLQLGKTRFSNHERPSPVDEARSVLRPLEEVFYDVLPKIAARMLVVAHGREPMPRHLPPHPNLQIGFWPGGDRDGNPFVTADVTLEVARLLKERVIASHHAAATALSRRLTFAGVHDRMLVILERLRLTWLQAADPNRTASPAPAFSGALPFSSARELEDHLLQLRKVIIQDHQRLFLDELDDFIIKVHLFGFHFASLDVRQSSDIFLRTLREVVEHGGDDLPLSAAERAAVTQAKRCQDLPFGLIERLLERDWSLPPALDQHFSALAKDTLDVLRMVPAIQRSNGELALHRVVISHTRGPEDVMVVLLLARIVGMTPEHGCLDIVPLFESIDDLDHSQDILARLFGSPVYRTLLDHREQRQTVMVGFSDGTKDGGYLAANWSIRQAKRRMTTLGRSQGIRLVFFDGRGGPPARGGGNTHRFYRSRDANIEQWETQLTIQGQTISSNFGNPEMASYHVEQLFTANIENLLSPPHAEDPPDELVPLLSDLSARSLRAYRQLRDDPALLEFLSQGSPLPLFDHLTIASRPVSRRASDHVDLDNLRAIPFVATFSVLKMQISGFYGLGTALEEVMDNGHEAELQRLYQQSLFFRALLDNAAMSLVKSRFDITAHLERDERLGPLWCKIRDEARRVEACMLRISRQPWLLANDPLIRASIRFREEIVFPLLVIVHDAFARYNQHCRQGTQDSPEAMHARKMALKGIAAVINATRNAA